MATRPQMRAAEARRASFEAEFASLTQQVAGIENDYRDLKMVVVGLDKKIEVTNSNLAAKIDASNLNLANKIDARAATPWGSIWAALGVLLAGITTVGWLALQPLNDQIAQLRRGDNIEASVRVDHEDKLHGRITDVEKSLAFIEGFIAAQNQNFRPLR